MYDHATFCAALTHAPFNLGDPVRAARAGLILSAAEALPAPPIDPRHLAYCFSTALWETAHTLAPIREIGEGRGRRYGHRDPITGEVYYGRGYVQTTWKDNYDKLTKLLRSLGFDDVDLVENPDLLLNPKYAAPAMFAAMQQGIYTGKKLSDYFGVPGRKDDPFEARRIINGLDHAGTIEGYYFKFEAALKAAVAQ